MAGEVVAAMPDFPVAVTPISDGIEKYVLAQAAGAAASMLASLVSVTTSGLLAAPLAPTVIGRRQRVCAAACAGRTRSSRARRWSPWYNRSEPC